ncbi:MULTISPECIES: DUF4209 domain-containing protein [Pseudanabaena]|uniref:DUF4209 domain-containing protein n=1 Tax=Pseudanabaena TaxID=1152 RepID=UPI00247AD310|nr:MULTISPECIES: DUF4209 domain-containing protein [Pseudanabaena]MEA5487872.1 DUF4209 domain-containing protein [Pseudanabaena sp. CCNP1317]WGS72176.1 DUF4209 domain-containing protein [Pseudanabaena galeata CCNP1313]
MNPSKDALDEKLIALETLIDVSEYDIKLELGLLRDNNNEEIEPCQEWIYEIMAFSFYENAANHNSGWGTYFGPMMTAPEKDGRMMESPSIQRVNAKVISYWTQRFQSTSNSLMQARYAGLVYDFTQKVTGEKPHHYHSVATTYCQALLKVAKERNHDNEVDIIQKLERALFIATSFKKQELITSAKEIILDYERFIAEDSKPNLWGFSFDLLIDNKKVFLSTDEEKGVIECLEDRLNRLKDGEEPWICEKAAERLARYYRSKKLKEECSRVIRTLGYSFESAASKAEPLIASGWLEHMHHVYTEYELVNDAKRILRIIQDISPRVYDDMKLISYEMEISHNEIESYIEQMLDGDLEKSLTRIAIKHIPQRCEIKKQLQELAEKAPISFLFTKEITDEQGRIIATVGSLEEDLDGNIVSQMSQRMDISAIFLNATISRVINQFGLDSDNLVSYLFKSPVFVDNQRDFLLKGIQKYLEQDYVVATHLLIPQIEATVRKLVEISGGTVLKRGRGGGFHLITLDDLLRSEQVKQALGEDASLYFRVVLTDQRGWNIRNDVCHGISMQHKCSQVVVERLIHILLVLGLLRHKQL